MKVVNPEYFDSHLQELKIRARRKVKLLKEKELTISNEAEQLLKNLDDDTTDHLYSKITRSRKERKHGEQISS